MDLEKQKEKAGGFLSEFKDFAMKGNVVDLAVGVVVGGAFGNIVSSLVADIIMPLVGKLIGDVDFSDLVINLGGDNVLKYGNFINNIIQFLIISFSIFIVIRQINKLTPKPEEGPVTTKNCQYCLSEIAIEASRCPNCTSELN